ncbi:hypothetical protein BD626DRAFT_380426, partial [Schizophyllum amplum]
WLKSYLTLGPDRPRWAYVVDALIARNISKSGPNAPDETRVNVLLQTWNANLYQQTSLPPEISHMFRVGKKYGIHLSTPEPSAALKDTMPIWYPIGQDPKKRRVYTSNECHCLQTRHAIRTAGEARALSDLLGRARHKARRNCACTECKRIRQATGCENPHKCAQEAEYLLDNLIEKWDPRKTYSAVRHLTKHERRKNERAHTEGKGGPVIFDPSYAARPSISDNFRIFTNE